MLKHGILNPRILDLLARVRHTNTLVIADGAFPFWPQIETVDIALTHDIPTVLDVFDLLVPAFQIGRIWQAEEFATANPSETVHRFQQSFDRIPGVDVVKLPHLDFKNLVPGAIGVIRTGDATPYANLIVESA